MSFNPVGDQFGILKAVWVMCLAFLHNHGDRATQLMV